MARRVSRFKKRESDRSGFDYREIRLVKDAGVLVAPEELDTPPPSKISLGGAGISGTPRADSDSTDIPASSSETLQSLIASSTIRIPSDEPRILIAGSIAAVNLTSNPQIAAGIANQIIGIQCVGSNVTLENGSGLSLRATYVMDSGSTLSLMYNATDNLWMELSRAHVFKNYGRL